MLSIYMEYHTSYTPDIHEIYAYQYIHIYVKTTGSEIMACLQMKICIQIKRLSALEAIMIND